MKRLISTFIASLMLVSLAAGKPVETAEEAEEVFRAEWRQSLAKKLAARPFIEVLKQRVFEERVSAESVSSGEASKLIISTVGEKENEELILVGTLEDLQPDRKVWKVNYISDFSNGFQAFLDPKDGTLIFFWITPH